VLFRLKSGAGVFMIVESPISALAGAVRHVGRRQAFFSVTGPILDCFYLG